ncbi:MAG TPA: proton-conducting transporter membrane subunit, partial [Thermomicrobiales bacterium]|nr:proton-conducting transporter membrane subunit [Thermomicrobiales bacterium]
MSPALAVVFGPLAATAAILLVRRWCGAIAIVGAAVSLVAAGFALADVARGIESATIVPGLPGMPLRLTADPLGALLALTVAVVSFLIFTYAAGAMAGDPGQTRFFAGMAFFAAAMQTLVLAGDWLLFLAAWELIGFASYLLIGFWFARPGVGGAATRAFTTTRAADLGLYLGVFILTAAAGTTAIAASRQVGGAAAAVAGLALLVAAIGKSAQVPLQGWLQDAMVGPTSVSALLHSATLVVAGVVLLSRADPLLTPDVRFAIGVVGGVTAVVAGLSAVAQRDVKRLLAASTSSQIGLMLLALGAGSVAAAVVHLVANAAMKSALFLGVGVFQHDRDSTAFAALAGVGRERRGVFAAVVVAGLALAGIPPLAGFWSKDAVIAAALDAPTALALAPLALAGALLTGIYVARMLRLLWGDASDGGREPEAATAELIAMGTGLAGLTALAAILGLALEPIGRLLGVDIPS